MTIETLFSDKSLKPKAKTERIAGMLLQKEIGVDRLIAFATNAKDPVKASCIEAAEFATRTNHSLATKELWSFAVDSLSSATPRVKWESARLVSNISHLFTGDLDRAITNLLTNTEHEGTVVKWSAATALGDILKLNTKHQTSLIPAIQNCLSLEEKNSIRKIYQAALKAAVHQTNGR